MAKIKYRLGLDVGAASIGWCVYRLDANDEPVSIVRMGARIISDGRNQKTHASLAVARRVARQARRRRDRALKRRHELMRALVEFGLMPPDEADRKTLQATDPYALRARGLDETLSPHELGRALFHLARKRGFRSNRRALRGEEDEKEKSKMKLAITALRERIQEAGCRTAGEYLAGLHAGKRPKPVRARRRSDGSYVMYMQRDMVEDEFDALWHAQRPHHPELLTSAAHDRLRHIMLFQRRLKPVMPGRCTFEPEEYRARLCSPLQQRFRVLQELNNLRVNDGLGDRALTMGERNCMLAVLNRTADNVTFASLASAAGLPNAKAFNYSRDDKRKGLKGNLTEALFSAALGTAWTTLAADQQNALAVLVQQADDTDAMISALLVLPGNTSLAAEVLKGQHDEYAILATLGQLPFTPSQAQVEALAKLNLPEGYGSLSLKALANIVPELESDVVTYDEAVRRTKYTSHSQFYSGETATSLPYYGEILTGYTSPVTSTTDNDRKYVDTANQDECKYGRIPNPTVHIGLNQLRQLVNALIKRYGPPYQIVIELTREFGLSAKHRQEIIKRQLANQERNEKNNAWLRDEMHVKPNSENRLRLRLWEELNYGDVLGRCCVYSGKRITPAMLFSDEIEIEHILPWSRSLHDGEGNKTLCYRDFNRGKNNLTPFEAWGHTDKWSGIEERAARLPKRKGKLFAEHAMETFLGENDFLARHLNDTAYFGRAAKQYLTHVCPPNQVWVSSGKLTGMIRGKYGLNKLLSGDGTKNRNDHRHHALDAAVIGLCSRSLIQRMARSAAAAEELGENRLLRRLELPWPDFRDELASCLAAVRASHKPDHGKQAKLHNDTNYGWRGEPNKSGNPLVGHRRPVESIKNAKDATSIASERIRDEVVRLLSPLKDKKAIKAALLDYSTRTGIRRVICQERLSVVPIHDRNHQPYRFVKTDGNCCYEVYRKPNGGWGGDVISSFNATQKEFNESPRLTQNGLPLVMRIYKGDVLALEQGETTEYMQVAWISDGKIAMTGVNEAGVDGRVKDGDLHYFVKSPSTLKPLRARLVGVDVLGYVNDPGFRG